MTSWDDGRSGHIRLLMYGKSHKALWRVIGSKVLVSSTMGEGAAFLGALKTAPATAACEKLKEMVAASSDTLERRQSSRPHRPNSAAASRFPG